MGPGLKFDQGKTRFGLLVPEFVRAVAEIVTFGAAKYAPNNWQHVESERYVDALLRHIYAWLEGEQVDQESHLHHLAHAACNIMFLMWKEEHDDDLDHGVA